MTRHTDLKFYRDGKLIQPDITERLRSPEFADVAAKYLMAEAAMEVERLRQLIADRESILHDCDAMLGMVWPYFGGEDAADISRLQQRIVDAVSN